MYASTNIGIDTNEHRKQLVASLPVSEKRLQLAGISTSILEGGAGQPLILLHGPGENSTWWMQVIPKLVDQYKVLAPDLPGHGASHATNGALEAAHIVPWLEELIKNTCDEPPVLVGHVLGGAIAARFAIDHSSKLSQLVLVDSLGLGKFRPSLRFAFGLIRFMIQSNEKNYNRFLPQCMYDINDVQKHMGKLWDPFIAYNLDCAQDKDRKAALQTLMKKLGVPKIPAEDLKHIDVPTALIWGRYDLANKLKIAKAASERYGWPLHIIEEARDDPKLEQPEAFLRALYKSISESGKHKIKDFTLE